MTTTPVAHGKAWSRVGAVILVTVAAVYAVKLTGLALATRRAAQTAAGLATEVAAMQSEVTALQTAEAGADAPPAVEGWARERGWTRPGDQPIAPVTAAPSPVPTPSPPPAAPESTTAWERFWVWALGR